MAILTVTNEILQYSKLRTFMDSHFDLVEEKPSGDPNLRRFRVLSKKYNLPVEDVEIAIGFGNNQTPDSEYIINIYKVSNERPREVYYHIGDQVKKPITNSDLRLRYHMETGNSHHPGKKDKDGINYKSNSVFSREYVEWLENELIKYIK